MDEEPPELIPLTGIQLSPAGTPPKRCRLVATFN